MSSRYGLEIRAAQPGDSAGLSQLLEAGGVVVAPRALADRIEALRTLPGTALLALEWGPPSGLVVLHWYRSLAAPHPIAQITALLVDPEQRRRGIGRLLVKAASQAARVAGCDSVELNVPAGAADLHAFCAATGFVPGGERFSRGLRRQGQP